jgi:CRP/FNR family transcriptional regulator, anaerobic regulatory protein
MPRPSPRTKSTLHRPESLTHRHLSRAVSFLLPDGKEHTKLRSSTDTFNPGQVMAKRSDGHDVLAERDVSIHALPFDMGAGGPTTPLLTAKQRRQLAALATRLRLGPRTTVYREGDALSWIYIIGEGLVKSFRELPSGKRRVVAFLFPRDLFGLAESGRYVNTTRTIAPTTVYRIAHEALAAVLKRDADLEFRFLSKVIHELRQAQRQAIVLGRRDASGRLAMFLRMLERNIPKTHEPRIHVPMSRTDIAEYLGLSLETVSRAAHELEREGIVAFEGNHTARVVDRARFEALVAAL